MKAEVEKIENNWVNLKIEVEAEKVNQALDRAYRKLVKEVSIPGFRKGKAPRKILENFLGTEPLYEEALDFIMQEIYTEAVEQAKIQPIDAPQVAVEQFEEDKPLILNIKVEVKPEIKLGEYKGIKIKKPVVEVKEEEVQEYLEKLQKRHARIKTVVDGTVEQGDIAIIDYKGFIDGQTFAGGIASNVSIEVGSGRFIEGFEEQLVGAKVGETREVKVTFPEDYRDKNLAGKEAVFNVTIKEIKRKELLPLDDEFAKDVSQFNTLEELKEDIRNKLKEEKEKKVRQEIRDEVIKKVVENAELEVPETLIKRRIDAHIKRLDERLKMQGYSLEEYCEAAETTEEELREKYREQAIESVKTDLVLEEIAQRENIKVSEDEIFEEIQNLAKDYNESVENVQKHLRLKDNLQALTYGLLIDKTIKFLVDHSSPVESSNE
ncbi:MAG TPA: trigger factor [Peptococcaceae bacterium]|nr:MAG: Trigger factor [Clostridia bacterium 41_269]HBT20375.1 trigger factor [Peptococcaceae bacterium]